MSAVSCLLTEDQFLCSICSLLFTDPVTIPCGHSFCKTCITDHWDIDLLCQCPTCRKGFNTKPELQVNTLISEMSAQFRRSAQQEAKEVPRDVCSGSKLMTWMFFLACLCGFMAWIWMVPEQKTQADILQMIQKEIKHSMELSKEDTDRNQAELIETINEKQRTTEKLAEGFVKDLKQEISELKKRSTEMEQLYVAQQEKLSKQKNLVQVSDLKRVQQYEVDLTLDPDTAHPKLFLSDDGKQVKLGDVRNNLPDNPKRFTFNYSVLAKQSFSSGRFYYEVQVKGETDWTLGVARESINRKGDIRLRPQDGYWTIRLSVMSDDSYYVNGDPAGGDLYCHAAGPPVLLSLKSPPQKVGVFVDYEVGLVSFYDVDAAALIYSYTGCSFTEKLYPYFGPNNDYVGSKFSPLIISPVSY